MGTFAVVKGKKPPEMGYRCRGRSAFLVKGGKTSAQRNDRQEKAVMPKSKENLRCTAEWISERSR